MEELGLRTLSDIDRVIAEADPDLDVNDARY
jgi:hypothetical protein